MIRTIWTMLDHRAANGPRCKPLEALSKSANLDHWTFCPQSPRVCARVYRGFRPNIYSSFCLKKVQRSKDVKKSCFSGRLSGWTIENAMVQKVQMVQEESR